MRSCRHCAHDNADHLVFCSRCGRRLAAADMPPPLAAAGERPAVRSQASLTAAFSRTLVATTPDREPSQGSRLDDRASGQRPHTAGPTPAPAAARSALGWVGESIGYIYVYLRGKLDAGERRRRLGEERAGAEALLSGAINELARVVLRDRVQHPALSDLLQAIARARARRDAAAADMTAAEPLQQAEASRLGAAEAAAEVAWQVADRAGRDAQDIVLGAHDDREAAATRLARVKDDVARLARNAAAAAGNDAKAAQLDHETTGRLAEQHACEQLLARLDGQLADLRDRAAALRTAAAAARDALERAIAARRQAVSAMTASIAGRQRDRDDAEREIGELTAQLGRVTADARPPHEALLTTYQNIDRLHETVADRAAQLDAIEQMQGHYDHRKLLTGVGLLASMLVAIGATLWAVLK